MWPYYVYELIDPRTGAVFYVGKGKGKRIEAHEAEARKGVSSDKCDQIRDIWAGRQKVMKREVARFLDEEAAYDHEADRIAMYTGLTNVIHHDATRAKVRHFALSPGFLKVVAWWLKTTDCGRKQPVFNDAYKPWATALRNRMVKDGRRFLDLSLAAGSFEDVSRRLRPFGVDLVRGPGL